jgi:hypothetical protein
MVSPAIQRKWIKQVRFDLRVQEMDKLHPCSPTHSDRYVCLDVFLTQIRIPNVSQRTQHVSMPSRLGPSMVMVERHASLPTL